MKQFVAKEWLFFLSLTLALGLSLFLWRLPHLSKDELEVLFILAMFFITIKGLEASGFLRGIALWLEQGRWVALKLLVATFLLSSFVTNDVALVTTVPLTLLTNIERKDLLVILEAITANAAALFPFGSPQNLYIYWHYAPTFKEFIVTIAPFVLSGFIFSLIALWLLPIKSTEVAPQKIAFKKEALVYLFFFILLLLAILKIVPLFLAFLPLFYSLIFRSKNLQIDLFLLATFLLFFIIADHLSFLLARDLHAPSHIFWLSVALSQVMSNVPATLLLANFTSNWQDLLWGVSVGGYGMLWGSLASLIAYRFYVAKYNGAFLFLLRFLALNFAALAVTAGCYYLFFK